MQTTQKILCTLKLPLPIAWKPFDKDDDDRRSKRSNCYLLISHQLFRATATNLRPALEQCERLWNAIPLFCDSHINHLHDTIALFGEIFISSTLLCATSFATSWLDFWARLDVNKINLLQLQSCHKFTPFPHIFIFSFYNIIVMFEIIYSVLSLLHKKCSSSNKHEKIFQTSKKPAWKLYGWFMLPDTFLYILICNARFWL